MTLAGDLYENILGRTPSLAEATGWVDRLNQRDFDLPQAAVAFAGSPEGALRLSRLDNAMVTADNPMGQILSASVFFRFRVVGAGQGQARCPHLHAAAGQGG